MGVGGPEIFGTGAPAPQERVVADPRNTLLLPHVSIPNFVVLGQTIWI